MHSYSLNNHKDKSQSESPEIISASISSAFSNNNKNKNIDHPQNVPESKIQEIQSSSMNFAVHNSENTKGTDTNVITLLEQQLSTLRKIPQSQINTFLQKLYPVQQMQPSLYISLYRSLVHFFVIMLNKAESDRNYSGLYLSKQSQASKYYDILREVVRTARLINNDLAEGLKKVLERVDARQKIMNKISGLTKNNNKYTTEKKDAIDLLSTICLKPKPGVQKLNTNKSGFDFRTNYIKQSQLFRTAEINIKQRTTITNMVQQMKKYQEQKCLICNKQLSLNTNHTFQCRQCYKQFHKSCTPRKQNCPFCQLRNINPLNEIEKQLFVGILRKNTKRHDILFNFDPDDKAQSFIPEKFRNSGININANKMVSVQLRCLRIKDYYDCNCSYITLFPDSCTINLNNRQISQFRPLHRQSSLKYRKDETVKLNMINLKRGENMLSIFQRFLKKDLKPDDRVEAENHLIGIYILKDPSPTPKDLVCRYQMLSFEQSQNLLRDSLLLNDKQQLFSLTKQGIQQEPELACENTKISLICSLTLNKLAYPGRTIFCTHFTCFDIFNFLMLNSSSSFPKWQCPICKVPAYQFRIDPIIKGILDITRNAQNYGLNLKKRKGKREWMEVIFNRDMKFSAIDDEQNQGQVLSIYDLPVEQKFKRNFDRPLNKINENNIKQQLQQALNSDGKQENKVQDQLIFNTQDNCVKKTINEAAESIKQRILQSQYLKNQQTDYLNMNLKNGKQNQMVYNSQDSEQDKVLQQLLRQKQKQFKLKNPKITEELNQKNKQYINNMNLQLYGNQSQFGSFRQKGIPENLSKIRNCQSMPQKSQISFKKKQKQPFVIPQDCEIIQLSD